MFTGEGTGYYDMKRATTGLILYSTLNLEGRELLALYIGSIFTSTVFPFSNAFFQEVSNTFY